LKNVIDWVSRSTSEDEEPLSVLKGKSAAILAGSPGGLGGSRGLDQLRGQLERIRIEVLKEQVTVAKIHEVMDEDGELKDPKLQTAVVELGAKLVG
jgi:NAD(P)H-dependent FMN reductase